MDNSTVVDLIGAIRYTQVDVEMTVDVEADMI